MVWPSHMLVSFGGQWTSGDAIGEIWECGIRTVREVDGGFCSDPDNYLSEVHGPLSTWFHGAGTASAFAQMKYVKANNINPDGTYQDPVTHVYDYPSAVVGVETQRMDGISSLCYSWTTGISRGLAHRGRIYPPNGIYALAGAFTVSSSDTDLAVTRAKALLDAIKQLDGGSPMLPAVVSGVRGGAVQPITGVAVGNVYDSQRRRRNRLQETYSADTWS